MQAALGRQMRDAIPSSRSGLDRRTLLGAGLLAGLAGTAQGEGSAIRGEGDGLAEVLDPDARLETLYEGGRWCEGPVWVPRLGGLVFSDVRSNRMLRLAPGEPATIFREPSANANGNALDAQGRLLSCEHRTGRVVRQEADGRLSVLAERFEGRRLNSPNDLAVARDGAIWFTDPTYGIDYPEEGIVRASEQRARHVFRLAPDGRLDAMADGFEQPNGLTFSPDGRTLYVSESAGATKPDGRREIRAFDVSADAKLSRERIFTMLGDAVPDGLKVDRDGRLYAGTSDGARIWHPDGSFIGRIATPGPCANIAFGGSDGRRLFLCAGSCVHAIRTKVAGAGLPG